MKALSIKEPYASMILKGKKTIETRTWRTKYRGLILLHASQKPKSKISGCIFAVARIVACLPMVKKHKKAACCKVYPKAWSWCLEDIKPVELKKVKGKLGLWDFKGIVYFDEFFNLTPKQIQKAWENFDLKDS